MKRSEMIGEIVKILYPPELCRRSGKQGHDEPFTSFKTADAILTAIERAGMLPPSRLLSWDERPTFQSPEKHNSWEPEETDDGGGAA